MVVTRHVGQQPAGIVMAGKRRDVVYAEDMAEGPTTPGSGLTENLSPYKRLENGAHMNIVADWMIPTNWIPGTDIFAIPVWTMNNASLGSLYLELVYLPVKAGDLLTVDPTTIGKQLPAGIVDIEQVPEKAYWLTIEGSKCVGKTNLQFRLTRQSDTSALDDAPGHMDLHKLIFEYDAII